MIDRQSQVQIWPCSDILSPCSLSFSASLCYTDHHDETESMDQFEKRWKYMQPTLNQHYSRSLQVLSVWPQCYSILLKSLINSCCVSWMVRFSLVYGMANYVQNSTLMLQPTNIGHYALVLVVDLSILILTSAWIAVSKWMPVIGDEFCPLSLYLLRPSTNLV